MKLLFNNHDVGGEVVKDNETYLIKDNKTLKYLVLSSTSLRKGMMTRGHAHPGQEEVYIFVRGSGVIFVEDEQFRIGSGSVVLIPDGAFHTVINDGDTNLIFNCVFNGERNH